MGVVNVTPDSFSDGGRTVEPEKALALALQMEEEGAAIIDVGGESSRPGACPVSAEEELSRILPVLHLILPRLKAPVSVDTYKFEVMERALDLGVSMINDITAGRDGRVGKLLARYPAGVVLMHMRGDPRTMQDNVQYRDLKSEIHDDLRRAMDRALEAGIARERILIDPGVGFGKSAEGNMLLLKEIGFFKERLKRPVLIGVSRKSFLRLLSDSALEDMATANAVGHTLVLLKGADVLRAHDVKETMRVVRLVESFWESR